MNATAQIDDVTKTHDIEAEARSMADDAASFFGHSYHRMHAIAPDDLAALQIAALRYRFQTLLDAIPMLQKLADKQSIDRIDEVADVVPLLFEHTMYKSYPPALLEKNRFADIVRWLGKLTSIDLSGIDVSGCDSIDAWFEVMDRESPLSILHSSGTSGTMSFLPCSKHEWAKFGETHAIQLTQTFGEPDHVRTPAGEIWGVTPFFRSGASAHLRMIDNTVRFIVGAEERMICAYPSRMSSDVLFLAARVRAAQARGELDRLEIGPGLLARKAEYEKLEAGMPAHLAHFFNDVSQRLAGKRVFVQGTWNVLHGMATAGLAKGLRGVFSPDSLIVTGGGAKGMMPPENWKQDVIDFVGSSDIREIYAMSEVQGGHLQCEHDHYHFAPWVIPILLDPETSRFLQPEGVVTGRAAFFDLSSETRWGGFITGDELTVNWDDPCPCGRTSAYAVGPVRRFSEINGGDDKITCAATENAHQEAMSFLTNFE